MSVAFGAWSCSDMPTCSAASELLHNQPLERTGPAVWFLVVESGASAGPAVQRQIRYTTPMPPRPKVVLEIDDNTPADEPPFTYDVSMWSFDDDLNLRTRTGAEVFRKMHEAAG